jgi:sugar/nucleoside kinase (ribokinase family)
VILVSGIAVVDLIASGLPRVARPGELVFGSVRFSLGGHACNVSSDLVRLGFPASRVRAVFPAGRDMFGRFLSESLRREGVRAEAVAVAGAPTSLDLILVAAGQDRRYHADPGANSVLPPGRVVALLEKYRPRLFYCGGAGLLNKMDAGLDAVLRRARELGALTFVDVVSPFRQTWDFLRRALPWTDFFHCNADEAADLTGERRAARAAEAIRRLGAAHAFVTMGGRGAEAAVPGGRVRVPAFRVEVADPTGAGDAFSAGLMLRIYHAFGLDRRRRGRACGTGAAAAATEARPQRGPRSVSARQAEAPPLDAWRDMLTYASACGAVCCTGIGTTTSVSASSVSRLLASGVGPS